MAAKSLNYAKTTGELQKEILRILQEYRDQGGHIIDRYRCINFGSIFQDGISSYSNIDLFCERIFLPSAIKKLKKNVDYIKDEDQTVLEAYNKAKEYVVQAAEHPENATEEEIQKQSELMAELESAIKQIRPETKEMELPFYVNELAGEEFPVVPLASVSEEALSEWAERLAQFVEVAKLTITPAAFSPVQQPDGLSVMKVKALFWIDIVVR